MTKTKVVAAIFGLLLTFMAGAQAQESVSATDVPSAANDKSARVSVLDKQTNRLQTLVMVAGQMQTVGGIDITLTKCLPDYAGQLGQDVAWLDVKENAKGNGSETDWFSGWMFNTYPEVSTLDHPRYDVILQGCGTKARKIIQTIGSAPVIEKQEAIVDTETAGDPYAVPGVQDASPAPKPEEAAPAAQPVDTEAAPAEQPAAQPAAPANVAPVVQPVAPTPPVQAQPAAQEQKQDLHELMDSGTY